MIQKLRLQLISSWQPILVSLTGGAALLGLMFFRLGTLTPGLSRYEAASLAGTQNIADIGNNPVNAPFKLLEWVVHYFDQTSPLAVRSVSVFLGLITAVLFFYLIKTWHTIRIAALGVVLFATSAWFLHIARQSTPDILLVLGVISILAYGSWLRITHRSNLALLAGALLFATAIYIPGMIWILVIAVVWQRKELWERFRLANWLIRILSLLICLLAAAALSWAIVRQPYIAKPILGLPVEGSFSIKDTLVNLVQLPVRIFYRGPDDPSFWLGRLSLLGTFATVAGLVGVYAYAFKIKLDRTKALLYLLIISIVLSAVSGQTSLPLLLPIMYILAISGVTLMLQQWLTVFPRNPLARSLGRGLITIIVILAAFFHINHYYVAWPNSPDTKAAFSNQQ